jgi:hypothetical protein
MGRGRAKAKQTKVARELKYSGGNTDLSKLQAELTGGGYHPPAPPAAVEEDEDEDDLYSKYIEDDEDDDE